MSWSTYYQRRDAMDAVERTAARNPDGPLPFTGVPGVAENFTDHTDLLLALQLRWTRRLEGPLGLAEGSDDPVSAVTEAWQRTARANPALRAVLDAHLGETERGRAARDAEHRMLALCAGLAEFGEPADELTRVGAAFAALLRETPGCPVREAARTVRRPVRMLRELLAS